MKIYSLFSKSEAGFITLRKLGLLMFFGFTIYYGFWLSKFYFDHYTIKNLTRDLLSRIFERIHKLGTPIFEEDFTLHKDRQKIIVKIEYKEFLYFGEYALIGLPFDIYEVRYFK